MRSARPTEDYTKWNHQQLIERIKELESNARQHEFTSVVSTPVVAGTEQKIPYRKAPKQPPKAFDASKYSTRLIALKFAYLGQRYNGFEHHKNNRTPLPTIEEELWKALVKTRLINPIPTDSSVELGRIDNKQILAWEREGADVNWEGCEYSKCGRTDRGVSAFGQVIGVRVRSNRPLPESTKPVELHSVEVNEDRQALDFAPAVSDSEPEEVLFDPITDELPYIQLLNRVLPPDIRILAWCPNPSENFSARFSCKERRYKYFFTNPCFPPVPGSSGLYKPPAASDASSKQREGWLDIEAMREGCRSLIGLHDFRNFCKIDASKQLTNFQRRIFHADIEEVSPLSAPAFLTHSALASSLTASTEQPKMYAFVVHGSAFLWHQVRSLVAVLFLVGQGLEKPEIVRQLLDIENNPTRPKYEMASDAPLVLWDCIFPAQSEVQSTEERGKGYEDRLDWIYVGEKGGEERAGKAGIGRGKWGRGGVVDDVWEVWRGRKIEEVLAGALMDVVVQQGKANGLVSEESNEQIQEKGGKAASAVRVFDGGVVAKSVGKYIPVMSRERMEPVEIINERYARKKGWDPSQLKVRDVDADE